MSSRCDIVTRFGVYTFHDIQLYTSKILFDHQMQGNQAMFEFV